MDIWDTIAVAIATIIAWVVGLIIDDSLGNGDLGLRVLFSILVMGIFIMRAISKKE
jgi:hypothetical protein